MTNFPERRIHSASEKANTKIRCEVLKIFSVGQEPDPPNYIRQSPIAAVFGSAGASPSHFIPSPSCVPRPVPFLFLVPCPN